MKDYYMDEWAVATDITTTTTSSSKEMMPYDYAELEVDSTHATNAWTGTVQAQASIDNSTFYNYGGAISAEGFYILDPLPRYIKFVNSVSAGTLTVHLRPVTVK